MKFNNDIALFHPFKKGIIIKHSVNWYEKCMFKNDDKIIILIKRGMKCQAD